MLGYEIAEPCLKFTVSAIPSKLFASPFRSPYKRKPVRLEQEWRKTASSSRQSINPRAIGPNCATC